MNAEPVEGDGGRSASFLEAEGVLVVRDRGLFRPGFEAFCRRLAESAVSLGGVRSAFVCLASGTCRLEFEGGRFTSAEMAEWFAESVRIAAGRGGEPTNLEGAWVSLRVAPDEESGSSWETTREGRGVFRLRHPALLDRRDLARRVSSVMLGMPGVESCRVTFWGGDLDVRFDRDEVCPSEALVLAGSAYRRALAEVEAARVEVAEVAPEVASGWKRAGFLALAGGSFALTIFGLIIPGVPTVPFLLATSYFLVRSSPALNEKLLDSAFFGPIVADLEFGHGLQRINRIKLIAFSVAIPLATILLLSPAWPLLLVILAMTSVGMFAITRIPAITSDPEAAPDNGLALSPA